MQQDVERKDKDIDTSSLINWLKLAQIPNFSVAKLTKLQKQQNISLGQVLSASNTQLETWRFNANQIDVISNPDLARIDLSLNWLTAGDNRFIIYFDHPLYPEQLKEIASPPALLYGYGNPKNLSRYQIGMVGSRNPSPQGKENAKSFANQLSEYGWTVTSGLALGVDGLSHQGALAGAHITIAVLGTAIDKMYPRRHIKLAEQILQNDGVIISEFPPGTPSRPENFPRRNRIISGLSQGTLIVEAAIKSGSLITAKYSLEQNREVFAIPGNIHNPMSAGCHYLIQQGAKLVTNILFFPQFNVTARYCTD